MDFSGGWADDDDAVADPSYLPKDNVAEKGGFKIYTSYRIQDSEKQKVERKFKVVKKKKLVSKAIKVRRQLPKFGMCAEAPPGPEGETTIISRDEYRIDNPNDDGKAERKQEEELLAKLANVSRKKMFQRKMDEKKAAILGTSGAHSGGGLKTGTPLSEMAAAGGDPSSMGMGIGGAPGKYVPVQMRGGATGTSMSGGGGRDDELNTLRVTNISEDTTEDDLRDLFERYGKIQRVYLAKDRETQISRGFAYISYYSKLDAEAAMDKLNGFGYDYLILKVEWARPSTRDSGSENVMKHVSGYGGALPQNTGN